MEREVDVKDAVRTAMEYITTLYQNQELRDLQLEEVEFVEGGKAPLWLVTLGFDRPSPESTGGLAQLIVPGNKYYRVFKTFHIDARSGELRAMKIRQA